jgi:hypothetical protein
VLNDHDIELVEHVHGNCGAACGPLHEVMHDFRSAMESRLVDYAHHSRMLACPAKMVEQSRVERRQPALGGGVRAE